MRTLLRSAAVVSVCLALVGVPTGTARAQDDLPLQNDGLVNNSQAAIQLGFVNGEIGAATFTVQERLFPLKVKKVQILWLSRFGSAPDSLQHSIRIYSGGLPSPSFVDSVDGPILIDGFLNEFDLADYNIWVTPPDQLTVGMQFDDAPAGDPVKPSLVTDTDGCQPGKSPIYAIPLGWRDICSFGASGDLVIRAVVETSAPLYEVGDLNCDGEINGFDIDPFVLAIENAAGYQQQYPDCDVWLADINGDGWINGFDIDPFVDLLIGL
ncbi:MAG: hypothetical protein KKB50_21045 [Planctomycetes bacterium]|nr:hypothetical protein [Planctomycetota bacterium]